MDWLTPATLLTLDGSGSGDPDGDELTYSWALPISLGGGTLSGVNQSVDLPGLGTFTIELTVDDGRTGVDTDTVTIEVQDVTPPNVTAGLVPICEDDDECDDEDEIVFRVIYNCSDDCDLDPTVTSAFVRITGLESHESGGFEIEWDEGELEIETSTFELVVTCIDSSGNVTTVTAETTVPPGPEHEDEYHNDEDHEHDEEEE